MGIELNATLNSFIEWAQRDNVGNDNLVHATALPSKDGMQVKLSDNKNDGIGFCARWRRDDYTKNMNNATRTLFKNAVMDLFNAKTINDVPKAVRDKMKLGDYDKGRPLSARRILAVVTAVKDVIVANAFNVSGTGEAATEMKGMINDKLDTLEGTEKEKMATLKSDMNRIAKNRFNMFFADDMKAQQTGQESQFEKDHYRLMSSPKFKIGNETLTFNSNTPLEEKKDIIAKFVKKDVNAKFSDLKGPDLKKAYTVMTFSSQLFGITMMDGVVRGLAHDLNEPPIQFGQQDDRRETDSPMEFSFRDDGSLRVHLEDVRNKPQFQVETETSVRTHMNFEPGSSVICTSDVEIDAKELEKISNTDYTVFDRSIPETAMDTGVRDQNEAGAAAMGDLRFGPGVTVRVSCTVVFNGGMSV